MIDLLIVIGVAALLFAINGIGLKAVFDFTKSSITASSGNLFNTERFIDSDIAARTVISDGNGTGLTANVAFETSFSLAPGGSLYIDLYDGTGTPKDLLNEPISLATVKMIVISLDTPAANNTLRFGPAGNASGAPLMLANNTQSLNIKGDTVMVAPVDGWTVATGAGNICLHNSGNQTPQTGQIRIIGVGH